MAIKKATENRNKDLKSKEPNDVVQSLVDDTVNLLERELANAFSNKEAVRCLRKVIVECRRLIQNRK